MTEEKSQETEKKSRLRLTLDSTELGKIGTLAKDNKFDIQGVTILYADDPVQKLEFFIKAFRFTLNLSENVIDAPLKQKLSQFTRSGEKMYREAMELSERMKRTSHWRLQRIRRSTFNFVIDNHETIDSLIDLVFPLGKVVKQYDPNKSVGYY